MQFNASELLRGVGCILTTRNYLANGVKIVFSDVIDGVVLKVCTFVQEIVISHMDIKLIEWLIIRTQN